ncbi:MAG TPA: TorF family putative porin [Moraxellaceae bacterium]
MKLTKLSSALLAGGLLMVGVAAQAEEAASAFSTTGSVALTSNYQYRGIGQTSGTAAVQGAITLSHSSGLYASVWSSSVSFAQGTEMDPSIGYSGKAGDVGYDVGFLQYAYPGARNPNNFREVYGSVSYMGGKFGLAYSDDFFGETGKSLYTYLDYGTTVADFGVFAHVGYNMLDDEFYNDTSSLLTKDKYLDYKVAVNKAVAGVTLELAYVGTDLDEDECFGGTNDCEGKGVFTVSKAF